MVLFISGTVQKEYGAVPDRSSSYYVTVLSRLLSEAYDLINDDEIKGEIIWVKLREEEFSELKGEEITFILNTGIIFDRLYILKTDWARLFREWGLVFPGFDLKLKLKEAFRHVAKESIELYTKRDFFGF